MVYTPTASPPLRIGIMGGTFDPIHHGHLVAASEVANLFHLDEVIFVPTGQPWQKSEREVSAAEDRYLMTVIATASNPRFSVSRVDIDRPGPTYTIDTLSDLHNIFPTAELFFITGADALEKILTWREWEKAFDYATFVGVPRPGYLTAPALLRLRQTRPPLLFAHSGMSGYSVFEEAAYWGAEAAKKIIEAV